MTRHAVAPRRKYNFNSTPNCWSKIIGDARAHQHFYSKFYIRTEISMHLWAFFSGDWGKIIVIWPSHFDFFLAGIGVKSWFFFKIIGFLEKLQIYRNFAKNFGLGRNYKVWENLAQNLLFEELLTHVNRS